MLNIKLTNCRECGLVSKLIDSINCQLAKMANNLYLNMTYMLDNPVDGCIMSTLLHYKRILTYKSCNEDWASDYSVDQIASKVNFLTVGCKCCRAGAYNETTTTTSTTTEYVGIPTTTTTTTIEIYCAIYIVQGNVNGANMVWSALDCLGNPVGGVGVSIDTGCINGTTLEIVNGYIKDTTLC